MSKINEIAEQAGLNLTGRVVHCTSESLTKFAELIVRECLEACNRANEIRHFVPPTQEQVVLSCMREIETTFRS